MVNIIRKGANYGYSQREGNQLLQPDNVIAPLPAVDKIAVQIGDEVTDEVVVPTYPVVQYGHVPTGGDGIGSGYVYTGKALPALRGKYIFSDLSTGRVWYADWKEMLAADDGDPEDDGADARSEAALERSGPRHLHVDRAGGVSGAGRQGSRSARPRNRVGLATRRRAVRARRRGRAVRLQQDRRHDPAGGRQSK